MNETTFKRIFLVGALWNLLGGAFIIFATGWIFSSAGLAPPSPAAYYHSWIALFMVFGLGYYLVSRNPYRNRDIALLGATGKLAFAAVFLESFLTRPGQLPGFFLIPVAGDIVFAVLFLIFVGHARRVVKEAR